MIRSVFAAEGVPLDLAYVPLVESAFKPNALSRASARGMWQFMPAPARNTASSRTGSSTSGRIRRRPRAPRRKYLEALNEMFDGDWNLALASYNAGPGRVQRAVKRAKTSDYWKLTSVDASTCRARRATTCR